MFIHITDPADHSRILLNASFILMIRAPAQGGSTVYLSTGATHHPDVVRAMETPAEILERMREAGAPVPPARAGVAAAMRDGPVESGPPAH